MIFEIPTVLLFTHTGSGYILSGCSQKKEETSKSAKIKQKNLIHFFQN